MLINIIPWLNLYRAVIFTHATQMTVKKIDLNFIPKVSTDFQNKQQKLSPISISKINFQMTCIHTRKFVLKKKKHP